VSLHITAGLRCRDAPLPGVLLRRQGVEKTTVLRLEHHRTHGQATAASLGVNSILILLHVTRLYGLIVGMRV